jgi:hypothetical protein
MLLKLGVGISRLEYHCRKVLGIVEVYWAMNNCQEGVITSTYEGTHSVGSLHYQNRAFDMRLPVRLLESEVISDLDDFVVGLRKKLGKDFDVVKESTHIHIEYDPK